MTSGVDVSALKRLYGEEFLAEREPTIEQFVGSGLLERSGNWLRLAERSTMLANDIICRLL